LAVAPHDQQDAQGRPDRADTDAQPRRKLIGDFTIARAAPERF